MVSSARGCAGEGELVRSRSTPGDYVTGSRAEMLKGNGAGGFWGCANGVATEFAFNPKTPPFAGDF